MKEIQFQYRKTPVEVTLRRAAVLSKPSPNYFTVDTTDLDSVEHEELMTGLDELQKDIDKAFANRTKWLKEKGIGGNFRNFSEEKMDMISG